MNIWLPLFWSTWSRAWGSDSATCACLAHRRGYSYCRESEQKLKKCLAIVFAWIVENTWTMAQCESFSNIIPETVLQLQTKTFGGKLTCFCPNICLDLNAYFVSFPLYWDPAQQHISQTISVTCNKAKNSKLSPFGNLHFTMLPLHFLQKFVILISVALYNSLLMHSPTNGTWLCRTMWRKQVLDSFHDQTQVKKGGWFNEVLDKVCHTRSHTFKTMEIFGDNTVVPK